MTNCLVGIVFLVNMNSILCDIVILPSEELKTKTVELSKSLRIRGTLYTLDGINFHPHASLYMARLRPQELEGIKVVLENIASVHKCQNLKATKYYQVMGFLDIEYQRTQALDDLASAVVKAINPVRNGMPEQDKLRMESATGLALENYRNYGYKYVGELFRPHISITRFKDEQTIDTNNIIEPSEFNGTFTKLGLFEMGDNGTCVRQIVTFELA